MASVSSTFVGFAVSRSPAFSISFSSFLPLQGAGLAATDPRSLLVSEDRCSMVEPVITFLQLTLSRS
jgi:hypothetical protein